MKKPKSKYAVIHNGFQKDFYEWEKSKALNDYEFWKNYFDCKDAVVSFYEDGVLIKQVTYKVVIKEEIFSNKLDIN